MITSKDPSYREDWKEEIERIRDKFREEVQRDQQYQEELRRQKEEQQKINPFIVY